MLLSKTEYVLVEGFYPATNGISPNGKFHGAVKVNGKFQRVMVEGNLARAASRQAVASGTKVRPSKLVENFVGTGTIAVRPNGLGQGEATVNGKHTLSELDNEATVGIQETCPKCGNEFSDDGHGCPNCKAQLH